MSVKDRLTEFVASLNKKPKAFEREYGFSNAFLRNIGFGLRKTTLDKLAQNFPQLNLNWLLTGEGNMLKDSNNSVAKSDNSILEPSKIISDTMLIGPVPGPGEETEMTPLGNNQFGITVPLIPVKAYAGYLDNFGDPEYYETLSKHTVSVTGFFRGRYFAFVVEGDSMENYSTEELAKKSIPRGAIVTGREIQKHHWKNKLHLHRFQNYVIVHIDGIITKEIIEHNTEEGYIICHSLNERYTDRKIMLDDCLQILNIINKNIPE